MRFLIEKLSNKDIIVPNKEDNIDLYLEIEYLLDDFKSNKRCIRDNCGPISWDLFSYLTEYGHSPKVVRGEFKTDNLNLLDKYDLTKEQLSKYKTLYDTFSNKNIVEFIKNNYPDELKDYYYLPHTWIELDGLIIDPSYKMFLKGMDSQITKNNYIKQGGG